MTRPPAQGLQACAGGPTQGSRLASRCNAVPVGFRIRAEASVARSPLTSLPSGSDSRPVHSRLYLVDLARSRLAANRIKLTHYRR